MIEWIWPWAGLLLPLPILMRLWRANQDIKVPSIRAPFTSRWQKLIENQEAAASQNRFRLILLWLSWIALVIAIARPQWIGEPIELPNSGRDLLLGLDLSGSMQIRDMQLGAKLISRVDTVKAIAADFTERREGDRVGLILFGSKAYLQAPLTFDIETVTQFIRESQLGFAGEDTAIGDALGLAIKRLKDRPAESRVFVLLTDGQDTASTVDPMEAASLASELGVRIYTIGVSRNLGKYGTNGGEVDEAMLISVADATGGRYFRARDPAELQAVYALLDTLEPVEQDDSTFRPTQALSHWSIYFALICLLTLLLLISGYAHFPRNSFALRGP